MKGKKQILKAMNSYVCIEDDINEALQDLLKLRRLIRQNKTSIEDLTKKCDKIKEILER